MDCFLIGYIWRTINFLNLVYKVERSAIETVQTLSKMLEIGKSRQKIQ